MKLGIGTITLLASGLIQAGMGVSSPDVTTRAVSLGILQLGTWITAAAFLIASNLHKEEEK